MAINVNMTGSGEIGEIQPGWNVNEYATPVTIGDTAGGTGTVNITAAKKPTSKLIVNNSITTSHDVLGDISGDVLTVNTTGPNVSLTHGAPLAKFDADANIPELYTGGVYPALDICSQLSGNNQLVSGLNGWYGSLAGHGALFNASGGRVYGSAYYVKYRYYNPSTGKYETQRIAAATNSVGTAQHEYADNGVFYASYIEGDSFSPNQKVANTNYVAYRTYVPGPYGHNWSFEGNPVDNNFDYGFYGYVHIDPSPGVLTVNFDYTAGGSPVSATGTVDISSLNFAEELYVFIKYSFKKNDNGTCDFNLTASVANVNNVGTYFSTSAFIQLYTLPTWYSKWTINGYARNLWRKSGITSIDSATVGEIPLRSNIAQNPSFESGILGWESIAYGTPIVVPSSLTNDSAVKYKGDKSLKVSTSGGSANLIVLKGTNSQTLVSPNKYYYYSLYFKFAAANSNVYCDFRIHNYDAYGNEVGGDYGGGAIVNGNWQRLESNIFTPYNAHHCVIEVNAYTINGANTLPTSFNIDAILIQENNGAETTYFDSTLTPPLNRAYKYELSGGQYVSNEYALISGATPEVPFIYDNVLNVIDDTTPVTSAKPAIGFKGNMWEYLQHACTAYGKEISVVDNRITLRDAGANVLDVTNVVASPTLTPTSTLTGKAVEVVKQGVEIISDGVVYDAYEDKNKILSVKPGETVTTTIEAKTYLTSVFQPERNFQLPNADGCYIVSDSTGLPIPTSKTLKLDTTATSGTGTVATVTTKSSHGIKPGDTVSITGVTPAGYNANNVTVTSVTRTTFTYANTTTGAQTKAGKVTYTSATTLWEDYGGKLKVSVNKDIPGAIDIQLTGPTKEIPGYSGPYKIAVSDDGNDFAALSILGRGIKSNPETVTIQTGAAVSKTTQDIAKTINNPFIADTEMAYDRGMWASVDASGPRVTLSGTIPTSSIDSFGITAGSLVTYEDCQFRVTDASISNIGVSFNASRFVDVADFHAIWGNKTVAYHDGVWDAFDTQDQIIMPFYGQDIVDGYIGFDGDGTPYLKVTGTGDGDASLLFDEDLTSTNYVLNPNFETDTAGWVDKGQITGGTMTRDTSVFYAGTASAKLSGVRYQGIRTTVSVNSSRYTKYYASFYFKGEAGKSYAYGFGGNSTVTFTATGGWVRYASSVSVNGANNLNLVIWNNTTGTSVFYVDNVQVSVGTSTPTYFDGSTTDTAYVRYEWSGTPNASTSLMYTKTPYYVPIDSTHLPTLLELDVDFTPYYI